MSLVSTQEKNLEAKNVNLKRRQNQVGDLYREIEALKTQATQANEQIKQQTTKLATSANEINRLQGQLTNATEARKRNIRNMQMRHAENIRAATEQIQALTKNVQERNAIIQRSKVAGRWQGLALGTQLRNTRTNLNRAQKEIGIARGVVTGLRGQRNALGTQLRNTQNTLEFEQKLRGDGAVREQTFKRQRNQAIEAVRASKANRMKERIATRRGLKGIRTTLENRARKSREQFNATGAFQNMGNKLAANRNAWKRTTRTRWQGAKSGVKAQENLRIAKNTLRNHINSRRPNGEYTICLLYTSPSPRDKRQSRMPSSA